MNRIIGSIKAFNVKRPLLLMMLLISTDLSILLDIPILRLVLGFTFFSVIPGLIILYILKANKIDLTEKVVLSVGLSISFLMFVGILINSLYPFFGYDTPLSKNSIVISFSVILLLLVVIASFRDQTSSSIDLFDLVLNTREKAVLLIPAFFPLLSILGMHMMNTTDNNLMPMALLFLIPVYAVFIAVGSNHVPERSYPLIIFLSSISLVLLLGLRSNHILGSDTHNEYYLFQQILYNERWQILLRTTLDSCLSITILPTAYQSFLGTDPEYLFKILYPFLFSIAPLIIYIISRKFIGNLYAFLASLFFMSQGAFLWAAANPRTVIAILFFALSVMVLFHSELDELNKRLLFIIFAVSCIVSHYSTTYIFFFILSFTWLGMQIIQRILSAQMKPVLSKKSLADPSQFQAAALVAHRPLLKPHLTIGITMIFFMGLFLWYSQITQAAFDSGVTFFVNSLGSFQEFFIMEARDTGTTAAFGIGLAAKGITQKVTFVFSWLSIAFIAIGVITSLSRYRHVVAFDCENEEYPFSLRLQRLDAESIILSLICSSLLVVAVALPFVLKGYGMERLYTQMMVVLSPFFVIGGINVAGSLHLHARWRYLIVLVVLIPYLMISTGIISQVLGDPQTIILNSKGNSYDALFIHDQETFAAKWLKDYRWKDVDIYSDYYGTDRLVSQGGLLHTIYAKSLIEDKEAFKSGYLYLRYTGVVDGRLMDKLYKWHNINLHDARNDKIYGNGGSEIYK
jgi:uncharacterized membrane protein